MGVAGSWGVWGGGILEELLRSGVDIFSLDYDAILAAMYALSASGEGDCYLCVPPDPGIEAAALGASESALLGTAPAEALHTFMLDSGASRCFFRESTTLTPLPAPVPVRLADPSRGPVLARSSTVLPCPAVPSGSLSGLHLPSFSTNLVSTAALQDAMVTTTTPGGQRVSICPCARTGRHLATFTRRPGSSLYTLIAEPPQVAASAQVSASGPVAAPCSCRLLSHQTLLWHHRLGHPSLPRLRGMHSRLLVSGLPWSLPPLPPLPAPPCLPCVKGRQRAAPHTSSFPPTFAPLQTLHMDVWGPTRVSGQGRKRYFLLVVDDYMRYTTVFPLRSKGEVPDVLIPWICAVRLQLRERFRQDLPVLRLHSDRGDEFSSNLLRDFCRREGILQSFMLPASPQQNGVAERRIGLAMEVARTSMIHAAAPHFLWPFAVRYAAHQLNLWPRVSLPETLPTLRWTGKVGDALVFRVWDSRAFVRDTAADKLFSRAIPCGPAPSGVSQVDPLLGTVPVEVAVDSGDARGALSGGAASGGAEPARAEPGGAEPEGAEPGGAKSEGAESGGAEPGGAELGGTEPEGAKLTGVKCWPRPRLGNADDLVGCADNCRRMHNGASRANRLRASASARTAVFYGGNTGQSLCRSVGTPSTCCVGKSPFCSTGVAPLHNDGRRSTMLPTAAIVTMVDFVANAGVADTLEACLADARARHADGEYGTIPLLIVELGIRSQWATEHPSRPVSPRPVRNEGGVDDEVDGGARVSGNNGTKHRGVLKVNGGIDRSQARMQQSSAAAGSSRADVDGRLCSPLRSNGGLSATTHVTAGRIALTYGYFKFSPDRITIAPLQGRRDLITWRESIEPQLEVAGLKGFADGTVPIPSVEDFGLRREFRAAHLLTFMVISRCCSPVVQLALRSCRERLDAGHQAWHFILSTYQVKDDLHIAQLEEKMTHIRMGDGRSTKDVDEKRSTWDKGRGVGGRRRECWICHDPEHLSYECPDRDDSDEDDTKGGRGRSTSRHPRRDAKSRKEKQTSMKTSSTKDVDNSSGKSRGDGEASCSMVGVVEPTVSLAPEAGEDFQAVAATVQANPMAVLLDSGCSHHLMGTKAVFVDMAPSDGVKQIRGFNGALQPVEGRGTVALQGEAGKRVLIPVVLYVSGIQANMLSAGQLKESGVQLKGDGDEMLLVATTGGTTPDRLHARLVHVSVDTIKSSEKHAVATGLDITSSTGANPPCVSCVGGKLAQHTFLDKGSDAEEELAVVHIDLCGPFQVAAKDGSLFFLLLKDRHTRFVWVMPVAKKSDVLRKFQKLLVLVERQAKKSVLMLRSDRGGEFLGKEFTDFVNGKGIVHDQTCPYTAQQNGMAEREMRTTVESVRTMLLHMGVQHHWWHLALRQAVWVRNCLERSTTPSGTTPYQLLTGKKPDLTLARVWGCMVQFMVLEQQRGGKLAPKARWGLHLGVSPESKGWEVLDLTDNKVVTSVEVIFYETLSLEVLPPSPVLAPPFPVADRPASTPVSATGNEGILEASPVAPASGIAGGRQGAKLVDQDGKPSTTGEQHTGEPVEQEDTTGVQSTGELPKSVGSEKLVKGSKQLVDDLTVDKEGELSAGEESTDSDVVEVPITTPELRRTSRA
ncbi:unnamed protein product [Closterium sp. NIES-54]